VFVPLRLRIILTLYHFIPEAYEKLYRTLNVRSSLVVKQRLIVVSGGRLKAWLRWLMVKLYFHYVLNSTSPSLAPHKYQDSHPVACCSHNSIRWVSSSPRTFCILDPGWSYPRNMANPVPCISCLLVTLLYWTIIWLVVELWPQENCTTTMPYFSL